MSIARAFPPLSQDDVRIAAKGRVDVIANPLARLNASHERLTGAAAPGQSGRAFRPHNHVLDGGATLGRGTIFSFDVGGQPNGSLLNHTLGSLNTWTPITGTSLTRECLFRAYVTPGLTGTLSCALIVRDFSTVLDVRISNITTGTSSSGATTASSLAMQSLTFTDVPMSPGEYNAFDVEFKSTGFNQMSIFGLCLYEDTATHPSTSGSTTYSGL